MQAVESKENREKKSSENCNSDEVNHRSEVTPQMIEAGMDIYYIWDEVTEPVSALVDGIFRTMMESKGCSDS